MANTDRPSGFRPFGRIVQSVVVEAGSECRTGEFVRQASDGQWDTVAAGETIGGCALSDATTAGDVLLISTYPEQLYICQADETEISAQTLIGNVGDVVATAEDSVYNHARMELDSSDLSNNTTSGQLVLVALDRTIDNAFGANAKCIVKINEHQSFGKDAFAGI